MIKAKKSALRQKGRPAHPSHPPDTMLGYHLRRLSVLTMADFAESLAPLGLKPASASVLFVIGASAGLTQSDAGRALGILRANMTPIVAELVRRGLIESERLDGRSQALRLSAAGEALYVRAWKAAQVHEKRLFGKIPPAARLRLIARLRDLWTVHEAERRAGGTHHG